MTNDQILSLAIIIIISAIMIFAVAFLIVTMKKGKNNSNDKKGKTNDTTSNNDVEQVKKDSIFKFMDFDDIKDNMIIRKDGKQFVMVIQCRGINFDLMSTEEQLAVEEGFTQFLNTLRFPVQLYVQTRSLNLSSGIEEYKNRINLIEKEIQELQQKVKEAEKNNNIELVETLRYQERNKKNVLDYGKDIVTYVAKMSQNKNVLQQKTYVIVNYYKAELGDLDLKTDDINDLVFSELYTRAQTIVNTLMSASIESEILDSEELAELLYIAYNRDEANILDFEKALDMQYDALYSTSEDVVKKKQQEIERKLIDEGINTATEAVVITDIKEKIANSKSKTKEKVLENALKVLERYKSQFEPVIYRKISDEIYNIVEEKYEKKTTSKEKNTDKVEEIEKKTKPKKKAKVTED